MYFAWGSLRVILKGEIYKKRERKGKSRLVLLDNEKYNRLVAASLEATVFDFQSRGLKIESLFFSQNNTLTKIQNASPNTEERFEKLEKLLWKGFST